MSGPPMAYAHNRCQGLSQRARAAMRETKELARHGLGIGKRKMVSMQECEAAGLVKRVTRNGLIVDWSLTFAGQKWEESNSCE